MKKLLIILLLVPFIATSQISGGSKDSAFNHFLGRWSGTYTEHPHLEKSAERIFTIALDSNSFEVRGKSENGLQGKFEFSGFFRYDSLQNIHTYYEILSDFPPTEYTRETNAPADSFIFINEILDPDGSSWKIRLTLKIINYNEYREIIELAGPGENLSVFTDMTFTRLPK